MRLAGGAAFLLTSGFLGHSGQAFADDECGVALAGGSITCDGDGTPTEDTGPYPDGISYRIDGLDLSVGGAATPIEPGPGQSGIKVTGTGARDVSVTTGPAVEVVVSGLNTWGISAANMDGSGSAAVTSSSNVSTGGRGAHALASRVGGSGNTSSTGNATTTMTGGAVSTTGNEAAGAFSRQEGVGDARVMMIDGAVSTLGSNAYGLYSEIENSGSNGGAFVRLANGSIDTTGQNSDGLLVINSGLGETEARIEGGRVRTIAQSAEGLRNRMFNMSSTATGRIVATGGRVETQGDYAEGMHITNGGLGAVEVVQAGTDIVTGGFRSNGIDADLTNAANTSLLAADMVSGSIRTTGKDATGIRTNHAGLGASEVTFAGGGIVTTHMDADGIRATAINGNNAEVIRLTASGGTIATQGVNADALNVQHRGTGAVVLRQSGAELSTVGAEAEGIRVSHAGRGATDVAMSNGSIETSGAGAEAIRVTAVNGSNTEAIRLTASGGMIATMGKDADALDAEHAGVGDIEIVQSGAQITTSGASARGVAAIVENRGSNGTISIGMSGGSVGTEGDEAHALFSLHRGVGAVETSQSGGAISTSGNRAHGLVAHGVKAAPTAEVTARLDGGTVATGGTSSHGLLALSESDGKARAAISDGAITTRGEFADGVLAESNGSGAVEAVIEGGTVVVRGENATGVRGYVSGSAGTATARAMATGGSIVTEGDFSRALVASQEGLGEAQVEMSGGTLSTTGVASQGLLVWLRNAANGTTATLSMSGGEVTTTGSGAHGAFVDHDGTGAIAVGLAGGRIAASGADADGLRAETVGGDITLDLASEIRGGTGSGAAIRTVTAAGRQSHVTLRQGADISAASGIALADGDGNATVTIEDGARLTGGIDLAGGSNRLVIGDADTGGITYLLGGDGIDDPDGAHDTLVFRGGRHVMAGEHLLGWERLDMEGGELSFTGSGSFGSTVVSGGELGVDGRLVGDVTVDASGTLSGIGTITGSVAVGGRLAAGNSPGTLHVGALTLAAGSTAVFELNTPGIVGGSAPATGNDLVVIDGDLTLGGSLDARVGSAGYFRLFDYGGDLAGAFDGQRVTTTSRGLSVVSAEVQTAIRGQVNIAVRGAGQTLQFWDGGDLFGNGTVDGGAGTWNAADANWTGAPGAAAVNGAWTGSVGVFGGDAGGTVTVAGTHAFDTLQFSGDGYALAGGTLAIGPDVGTISVGGGTTVTIASGIADGSGTPRDLRKVGSGTLVLDGANTFRGSTIVEAGTLRIGRDMAPGAGGLRIDGGRFEVGDQTVETSLLAGSGGAIGLEAGTSSLIVRQDADSVFAGRIEGSGRLVKRGTGRLTLGGAIGRTVSGIMAAEGTLVLNGSSELAGIVGVGDAILEIGMAEALGTARIEARDPNARLRIDAHMTLANDVRLARNEEADLTIETQNDLTLSGDISETGAGGGGRLFKRGAGTLRLGGSNSHSGGTVVAEGTLIGNAAALPGDLMNDATVVLEQVQAGTLGGDLSGTGVLVKTGKGRLSVSGDGTRFTGTTRVEAGEFVVDSSLGGSVAVVAEGMLGGHGEVVGTVRIGDGGRLAGSQGRILTMGALTLDSGATTEVTLGRPSRTAPFVVKGDLTLDGRLDIVDAGGFGPGVYRLFDYEGMLTDNGLSFGTLPATVTSADLRLQTTQPRQINLISTAGATLQFWDGGQTGLHDNASIDGGAGDWRQGGLNWTGSDGLSNGAYGSGPMFAVFQGNSGTVRIAQAGIGVTGMQFASDGYRIADGRLTLTAPSTVIRVGDGTSAAAGTTATIASGLDGNARLVKTDLGTLILTGDNGYTGGTAVTDGTLVGSVGSIRGDLANAGSVVFEEAGAATFTGGITGHVGAEGVMTKRGRGTLTLAGTSTLDWTISQGALVSATDRFTGDVGIAGGASMTFQQDHAGDYGGRITGTGALSIIGGGSVRLTGETDAFAGTTTIRNQTLVVDRRLGGTLSILGRGRLQGNGTVGSTVVGAKGTIAPGNSIGTVTMAGDLVFESGSNVEIETELGGSVSDRIAASGTATLKGGSVLHFGTGGVYDPAATYTILTAEGGVSGRFGNVASDLAFLAPDLTYAKTSVTLSLTRNDTDFGDIGKTPNQKSTGGAIEDLEPGAPLLDAVLPLRIPEAQEAFDRLSGDVHVSAVTALVAGARHLRETILDRTRFSSGIASAGWDGTRLPERANVWSQGFAATGQADGDGNAAGFDHSASGGLMGGDIQVPERLSLGFFAGRGQSSATFGDRSASLDSADVHAGFYGTALAGPTSLRLGLTRTWHDMASDRHVRFSGFSERLRGERSARTTQVFAELGHAIKTPQATLEPFVGLSHVSSKVDGFGETGGHAALTAADGHVKSVHSTLGLRISADVTVGRRQAVLRGAFGWQHGLKDTAPTASMSFAGGDAFRIAGVPLAKDTGSVELGVGISIAKRTALNVTYQGRFGGGDASHSARIGLEIRF